MLIPRLCNLQRLWHLSLEINDFSLSDPEEDTEEDFMDNLKERVLDPLKAWLPLMAQLQTLSLTCDVATDCLGLVNIIKSKLRSAHSPPQSISRLCKFEITAPLYSHRLLSKSRKTNSLHSQSIAREETVLAFPS